MPALLVRKLTRLYVCIPPTQIFSLAEKLWPLHAPNFGHCNGHQGLVTGEILGEHIKGILKGHEGKIFLWPLISFWLGKLEHWNFFPKGPLRRACPSKILALSIEQETRGWLLSNFPKFCGSISVDIRFWKLWVGSIWFVHQVVGE